VGVFAVGFEGALSGTFPDYLRGILKPLADLQRDIDLDGTRVRLFFGDAVLGQQIQNELGLDFQFTCQLVDSNHRWGATREFLSSNKILGRVSSRR
jgi:hypothetical protein